MKLNTPITLVIVCDNHLVVMLSVLLKSIEKCNFDNKEIRIYIIYDGINKANRDKVERTISSGSIELVWKDLASAIPKQIELPKDRTTYPVCAYARICAPYFLPDDVKRVIYLDVDMVLLRDIAELWSTDIGDYTIGAVQDRFKVVSSPWGGISNYKELGLSPDTKYFNSGLLLIDLERWRAIDATSLVLDAIHKNSEFVTFADQYALNVIFANAWHELDYRWNNYGLNTNNDPYLIHFTGIKPLFKGYCSNEEYKKTFYEILRSTPWADYKPKSNYVWKIKKLMNVIGKKSWETLLEKFLKSPGRIFLNKG